MPIADIATQQDKTRTQAFNQAIFQNQTLYCCISRENGKC